MADPHANATPPSTIVPPDSRAGADGQAAVGPAGGDAGVPGDDRGHDAPVAAAVFGAGDAEPGGAGRGLPAAGGAARPLPVARAHGLPRPRAGGGDAAAAQPAGGRAG